MKVKKWFLLCFVICTVFLVFSFWKMKEYQLGTIEVSNMAQTDIFRFMLQCAKFSSLVILEPTLAKCLDQHISCPNNPSSSMYRFGVIGKYPDDSGILHKMVSDLISLGWRASTDGYSSVKASFHGNLTIIVTLFEIRPQYWYIHGTDWYADEPARAFLGLNFTSVKLCSDCHGLLIPNPIDSFSWQWPRSTFIECNRTVAESFRVKYPDRYKAPPKIPDNFMDTVAHVRDLMIKHRMTPMVHFGTTLGWYRECGLNPDTADIDLMFMASEWNAAFEQDLKRDKIVRLYWILGKPTDSLELSVTKDGIKIDIFALYEEDNQTWAGGMIIGEKAKLRWWTPKVDQICTIDLKGHLFYTPCNIIGFLEATYGSEWSIPHSNDNWNFAKSEKNTRRHGHWTMKEWPLVYRQFSN